MKKLKLLLAPSERESAAALPAHSNSIENRNSNNDDVINATTVSDSSRVALATADSLPTGPHLAASRFSIGFVSKLDDSELVWQTRDIVLHVGPHVPQVPAFKEAIELNQSAIHAANNGRFSYNEGSDSFSNELACGAAALVVGLSGETTIECVFGISGWAVDPLPFRSSLSTSGNKSESVKRGGSDVGLLSRFPYIFSRSSNNDNRNRGSAELPRDEALSFAVRPPDGVSLPPLYLAARNFSEKEAWMTALSRAAAYCGVLKSVASERVCNVVLTIVRRRKFLQARQASRLLQSAIRARQARVLLSDAWENNRRLQAALIFQTAVRTIAPLRLSSPSSRARLARRRHVLVELLETEEHFVFDMELLLELFWCPLAQSAKRFGTKDRRPCDPIISRSTLDELFPRFRDLVRVHRQFLDNELRPTIITRGQHAEVAGLFSGFAPKLQQIHPPFVSGSADATQILRSFANNKIELKCEVHGLNNVQARQEAMQKVFAALHKDPRAKNQDLESLVIQPVQRVPRYEMLLKDLLKHTPDTDNESGHLHIAVQTICATAMTINEALRVKSSRARLAHLMHRVKQADDADDGSSLTVDLSASDQAIVREGQVEVRSISAKGKQKWTEMHVFLFADSLAISTAQQERKGLLDKTTKFTFKQVMDIGKLTVMEGGVMGRDFTAVLQPDDKSAPLTVAFASARDRRDWLGAIEGARRYFVQTSDLR